MQPITVKLTYEQCDFLKKSIEIVYSSNDENELLKDEDYHGLQVLCGLRGLYDRLAKATLFHFAKPKSFKLSPLDSLALFSMFSEFLSLLPDGWAEMQARKICGLLHQHALTPGKYLELPQVAAQKAIQAGKHIPLIG